MPLPGPVVLGICYLVFSESVSYDFTKFIEIFILITQLLYFLCIELNLQVDLLIAGADTRGWGEAYAPPKIVQVSKKIPL